MAAHDRVPPGQVVTHQFPVLHAGTVPYHLTRENWSLEVHGLVKSPGRYTFADLLRVPSVTVRTDIHCVTSWSKLGTLWEGAPVAEVMRRAAPEDRAKFVVMECEQGFTTSLPLDALLDDDVLLAYAFDGQPLPSDHGGPVRMFVPKRYFYKSAKWVRGLKLVEQDEPGFWEVRGYSNIADPWLETRYDVDDVKAIHKMRKANLFKPLGGPSSDR